MSLYKGNNLISGHQVLYSTTGSNTDGAMTQKAATDNFADVNLSNLSSSSSKNLDGQWVQSNSDIYSGSAPVSDNIAISLSTYLPNDGYNYEVCVIGSGTTGSTSGNQQRIAIISDLVSDGLWLLQTITRANAVVGTANSIIVPVGTGRELTIAKNAINTGSVAISLRGYRRIGTNQ